MVSSNTCMYTDAQTTETFRNKADLQAPTPDSILYAGERSIIRYDPANYTSNDTVTFFFDEDRSTRLACKSTRDKWCC